jgi:hypothetical protein
MTVKLTINTTAALYGCGSDAATGHDAALSESGAAGTVHLLAICEIRDGFLLRRALHGHRLEMSPLDVLLVNPACMANASIPLTT